MFVRVSRSMTNTRSSGLSSQRKSNINNISFRNYASKAGKRVAVILSGCGVFDGTEITEAASAMINFSREGHTMEFFAPKMDQTEVVDHVTGKVDEFEERDAFLESARITRGKVSNISEIKPDEFDALFLPGGFGAAKNLSNYAKAGPECEVNPELEKAIRSFYDASKPVAACCVAPVLVARVLGTKAGGPGVKVTVGSDPTTMQHIEEMGSEAVKADYTEVTVDEDHGIVTTPAYMYGDAEPYQIYDGLATLVTKLFSVKRQAGPDSDDFTQEMVGILRENADKLGIAQRFSKKEDEESQHNKN
eukprot:gb/GECH01003345.1/.p1 GENE.gb/GECH01003345.1/~~gb/GECH01003345.1/.p1  ORF type:complete len:305 (+),score=75.06 gb/GECH01003345.1/:1-915(+)